MIVLIDVLIVLAVYIPGVALLVWAVDGVIEALARRTQRREHDDRARPVRRTVAAIAPRVDDEPHLERLVTAGAITPAQLMGAPREAAPHPTRTAA